MSMRGETARQNVESLFTASPHHDWDSITKSAATLRHGSRNDCWKSTALHSNA